MNADVLKKTGREIFEVLKRQKLKGAEALERGAGGDRSFAFDKLAEDIILRNLEALNQPFSVVTEEAGELQIGRGGGKLVIIDPVDGSRNAAAGVPFYGTSIAVSTGRYLRDIELGYVINLVNGEWFLAEKGKGALQNGSPVRTQNDDIMKLVAFEAQNPGADYGKILRLLQAARKTRCFGSIALDLAYLSSGSISVFISPEASRSFDYAAGYILVREAGGVFTDTMGNSLEGQEISLRRGASLLASANQALHHSALDLLNG